MQAVKVKLSLCRLGQALRVEAPKFHENRYMKLISLLALRTGRLYPQKILLVLLSDRD